MTRYLSRLVSRAMAPAAPAPAAPSRPVHDPFEAVEEARAPVSVASPPAAVAIVAEQPPAPPAVRSTGPAPRRGAIRVRSGEIPPPRQGTQKADLPMLHQEAIPANRPFEQPPPLPIPVAPVGNHGAESSSHERENARTEPIQTEPVVDDALKIADRFMAELKSRRVPAEVPVRVEREKEIRETGEVVHQERVTPQAELRAAKPPQLAMPPAPRESKPETPIVPGGAVIGRLTVEVAPPPPAATAKRPAPATVRKVIVRGGQGFQSRLGASTRFGLGQL